MSRIIAPGKWDPIDRRLAKLGSFIVGVGLLALAYRFGVPLVDAVREGRDITVVGLAIVLVPLALGSAAVFPNVIPPLIIRAIDKLGKDTPEA